MGAAPAPVTFTQQGASVAFPAAGGSVVMGQTPSGGQLKVPQARFQEVMAGNPLSQSEILAMTEYPQAAPPAAASAVVEAAPAAVVEPAPIETLAPAPAPVSSKKKDKKDKSSKKKASSKKKSKGGCC